MDSEEPDSSNKKPNIKIREMEIDDIAKVFHLGEQLFKADETPTMYRTWDPFEITTLFNSDTEFCLVAEDEDEIVGFALGTIIVKDHSAWKYGYLIWLGVLPQYHRKGVAEKLFNRYKDLMLKNGVRMLMVDTPAENKRGLRFFNKMGFGPPKKHFYLTMNLAADQQRLKMKTSGNGNGNGHSRHPETISPVELLFMRKE